MELKTFIKELPEDQRDGFAARVGTTLGHIRNVMYGLKPCGPELAAQIEIETARSVRRWDLRPTDWHRIWPELIGADGAPPVEARREAA